MMKRGNGRLWSPVSEHVGGPGMDGLVYWALKYQGLGWSVIPVMPRGKGPLVKWLEFQEQRAGEAKIREWWVRWPSANVGVVTGRISGLVVLDVDGREGETSLRELRLHLPVTLASRTGRGWHYFFKHPGCRVENRARFLPGLDVRGDGGFVVVPPSVHSSGGLYEWMVGLGPGDVDVEVLPSWLQDNGVIDKSYVVSGGKFFRTEWVGLLDGVVEGRRNVVAARLAGRFLCRGFSVSETIALLFLWNGRNRPPLKEKDIETVVRSIANREVKRLMG